MRRRVEIKRFIPLASMADIAFILLVFFMVTTTLEEKKMRVELPKAEETTELEVREVEDIFINSKGEIMIEGRFIDLSDIKGIFSKKRGEVIVALNVDKDCNYGRVAQVLDELRQAQVFQVSLIVEKEL